MVFLMWRLPTPWAPSKTSVLLLNASKTKHRVNQTRNRKTRYKQQTRKIKVSPYIAIWRLLRRWNAPTGETPCTSSLKRACLCTASFSWGKSSWLKVDDEPIISFKEKLFLATNVFKFLWLALKLIVQFQLLLFFK